jgi:centrobin
MEVSQLLRLYQARGWGALPAEDLLLYLKRLEHSGYKVWEGGEGFRGWELGQSGSWLLFIV